MRPGQRALAAGGASAATILLIACASLPDIPQGACGNGVVEPSNQEDCDSFSAGEGTSCRAPGQPGACRFDCSAPHACPPGFGCGQGGICRAGNGSFATGVTLSGPDALRMSSGDFDGDKRQDLVVESLEDVRVSFFGSGGSLASTFRLPIPRAHASVGYLGDNGNADLILTGGLGVDVWRGQSDRTLAPTVFPSFPIPGVATRLIPLEALPSNPGREMLVMTDVAGNKALSRVTSNNQSPTPMFTVDEAPDRVAGEEMVGNFDESASSPCDEVALAFTGAAKVHVYTSCRLDPKGNVELNALIPSGPNDTPQRLLPDVVLPAGAAARGLRLGRVNGDAHLDLLIDTQSGALLVAYGVGDGSFHSSSSPPPPNPKSPAGDGVASTFDATFGGSPALPRELPLAIGDLNGDGADDLVTPHGILFYESDRTYRVALRAPQAWSWARIGNLDAANGLDVVASVDTAIDVYKSAGAGLFNHATYTTDGAAALLELGDVDGDSVDDIALRTSVAESPSSRAHDELTILFGAPLGYPLEPVTIGSLPQITELALSPYEAALTGGGTVDGIADIAAVVKNTDGSLVIAALPGRADRQLTSAFTLVDGTASSITAERAGTLAAFAAVTLPGGPPSIAAVAESASGGNPKLWLAPLAPAGDSLTVVTASIAPVATLNPIGDDNRVQILPLSNGASGPSALIVDPGGAQLSLALPKGGAWNVEPSALGAASAFRDWRAVACDFDQNGVSDVAFLYSAGASGAAPVVGVIWDAGASVASPPQMVAVADGTLGIACGNVDRDPAPELLTVGSHGGWMNKVASGSRAFDGGAPIPVAAGHAIAVADFDGDGINDLAVASSRQVTIYTGL